MHRIYILIIALLAGICGMQASPADFRTGRLFDDPVVVSGSYTGFCQDTDGFIWIGTNRGLLRFDGNAYDVYLHEDEGKGSISDSRVLDVLCDSSGRIWVATANGLNLYCPETDSFKVIPLPSKSFYGYIIDINEQADGTVTFLASGVGLYIISFKDDDPVAVRYSTDPVCNSFNTIICCPNGQMYFGIHAGDVYNMASNGKLTKITVTQGEYVQSLSLESDGNVIVGTLNRLFRIDSTTKRVTQLKADEKMNFNKLSNASNGKIYAGTAAHGLCQVKAGSDTVEPASEIYCPFVNLRTANIGSVYSSPDDNLWIGCNYKGVVLVPGKKLPFTYKRISDDFPDFGGGVNALALWKSNILVALDRGRIAMFGSNGRLLKEATLPIGELITSILVTDDDKALLGVAGDGVWQLDLNTWALSQYLDIPGKYPLVVLAHGLDDELFVGMHGMGLMRYGMKDHSVKWIPYKDSDEKGFSNSFLTNLLRTADDKLWICTYSGLACLDLAADRMIEVDQIPFLNGSTFTVASLDDGSVLAGTSQGVIRYDLDKGVVRRYTTADGLTDNDVRSMTVDSDGGVWIGTVRGLSYLTPDEKDILAYYGGYGLVENVINHTLYSAANNRIYLGNDLGLTSFRPESVPSPGFSKEVLVSAFNLNGERLVESDKGHEVRIEGHAVMPDAVYLPYRRSALSLRMSTMDYRDASNIRYKWRLDGGKDWNKTPPGENMIYLPQLDSGTHYFEVCAEENNVASPVSRIKIVVASPWYLGIFAKTVYFIIFLAMLAMGWIVFKKKRDEQINDEKIKFFMDISHDLRSPITLVLNPLESLMKMPFDDDVKAKLKLMHRNVYRMLSLVNQLLDIRKLEKGKMRLYCKQTDINSFVGEMVDMFRQHAEDKKQTLHFRGLAESRKVWLDRNNFDKILVNLISNAIKYTPEEGEIDVEADIVYDERLGESLRVSVKDTGIGLDSKTQAKIFERFYRVENDRSHFTSGFGIGLDLCRRLVDLHHGVITGRNREDGVKGSVFTVLIPLDESLYGDEELKRGADSGNGMVRNIMPATASSPAGELPTRPASLSAGKYILFVDDDEEMRSYVSAQLGKVYKVKTASNGAEALKMVADKNPDIIISDVVMPDVDGLKLLKRLKSNGDTNHIPVILLSSKTTVDDRMSGWDKGADGYLGKPFSIEELESLVNTLIENRMRMKGKYSGAQTAEGKIASPDIKGNDEILMERVLKVINDHIDDAEFSVENLSEGVGVSRVHLHRKLKDIIGMSPSDYIRTIRLKRACELLKRPDIEVTHVAFEIGICSQSHFSTHFKRYTGYSPSEYRARYVSGKSLEKEDD